MPTNSEILAGLQQIVDQSFAFAVLWHVAIAIAVVALMRGWRPSTHLAGMLLALPLASVSALAWLAGNPFNGTVFGLAALALFVMARSSPAQPIEIERSWAGIAGLFMVGFAWIYPHFLEARPAHAALYGAPVGLIPCPTLALVVGASLMGFAPRTRAWSWTVAGLALVYAAIGALRLGVQIDLVLAAGGAVLAVSRRAAIRSTDSRFSSVA